MNREIKLFLNKKLNLISIGKLKRSKQVDDIDLVVVLKTNPWKNDPYQEVIKWIWTRQET